jgi:SpoVK/Ycf46/Vps4 family AAA+-type ATPase
VLMALDRNAFAHPHILTVATSNFTQALDEAFRSRADLALEVPLPNAAGALAILERTLSDFGAAYPKLKALATSPQLRDVASALVGLDGRRIRKVVTEALAGQRATVLDPNKLEVRALLDAARHLKQADSKEAHRAAA